MIIYVDLLILLNFFIDLIILIGIDILLKRRVKFIRLILGSLLGSVSCLLLFYIHDNILILIYKLVISIFMVIVSFKYESFRHFRDNLIWLYIISIILGGSIYLLSYNISLNNNALIFYNNGLKINIILLVFLGPFIICKYIKNNIKRTINYSNYYNIDIYYNDVIIEGVGFLDTGNNLRDIYFNRPIILVNKSLIKEKINTYLIPFYTVNNKDLLEVFKPHKIVVNNKVIKNVSIGLSDVNINGIKILLNKEII